MKIKAKRTKNGFLIPLINGLEDKEEILVEIKEKLAKTEFLEFLYEIYGGKENICKSKDEEMLEHALREKYGL